MPTDADKVDGLRFILRQLGYREEEFLEYSPHTQPEFSLPESDDLARPPPAARRRVAAITTRIVTI